MQEVGHLFGQGDAALLGSLADLVAGGVEHHAGVVVVFFHHVGQILTPPLIEIIHVVMLGFVDVPMVDVLVHDKHALPVTLGQQRLRAGVVR